MFDLTDEERRVFLFLACLALAGLLMNFFPKIQNTGAANNLAKIEINSAGFQDLCEAPGVSAGLAKKIIACRDAKGGFGNLEELKEVKGIGEKRYEKLKDLFFVRQ